MKIKENHKWQTEDFFGFWSIHCLLHSLLYCLNTKNKCRPISNIELTEPKELMRRVISLNLPKKIEQKLTLHPFLQVMKNGEALEYKDLSNDPALPNSSVKDEFKTIDCELTKDCTIHEPRYLRSFFTKG